MATRGRYHRARTLSTGGAVSRRTRSKYRKMGAISFCAKTFNFIFSSRNRLWINESFVVACCLLARLYAVFFFFFWKGVNLGSIFHCIFVPLSFVLLYSPHLLDISAILSLCALWSLSSSGRTTAPESSNRGFHLWTCRFFDFLPHTITRQVPSLLTPCVDS